MEDGLRRQRVPGPGGGRGGGAGGCRAGSRESRVHLGAPHIPDQPGEFQAPTYFEKPAPTFLEPVQLWVRGNGVPKEAGS